RSGLPVLRASAGRGTDRTDRTIVAREPASWSESQEPAVPGAWEQARALALGGSIACRPYGHRSRRVTRYWRAFLPTVICSLVGRLPHFDTVFVCHERCLPPPPRLPMASEGA